MDKWILSSTQPDIKRLQKRESIWTQGNGYMGVRASFEEKYTNEHRTTLINGVFNQSIGEAVEIVVLPDATNFAIEINGESFSMISGVVENFNASLNMKTGELKRSLDWISPNGDKVGLEFSRIVSDVRKHIIASKVKITAKSGDVKVGILTGVDGKVTNTGVCHFDSPKKRAYSGGISGMTLKTLESDVCVGIHYSLTSDKVSEFATVIDRRSIFSKANVDICAGDSVTFEKTTSYSSSRDIEFAPLYGNEEEVINKNLEHLRAAMEKDYNGLLEESTNSMAKFWEENLIEVKSNDEFIDKTIIFTQYHLYIMASRDDNRLGIGAKALSGEGYMGHSFWDTELFLFPYYLFNIPKIAKNLLEYRYQLLDAAISKAKEMGFEGAMYPWECAWLDDGEVALKYGDLDLITGERRRFYMAETEIHVTSAISYAVWQYFQATGDKEFMEECGSEIIILTALFWASRAEFKNGRYEINGVIGPDEYKENVNNNAYTNYMAHLNMKFAQKLICEGCSENVRKKVEKYYSLDYIKEMLDKVADNLYLPMPESDGIIQQFDGCKELPPCDVHRYRDLNNVNQIFKYLGFNEILGSQVFKQADLVMLFYLMEDKFSEECIIKNFDYYEDRTLHDSSLSMCIHALIAARLGRNEMADEMFYCSCCVDLGEKTNNSDAGIHSASLGGIWLTLVQGYGGMSINEKGLMLKPVLPSGWEEYSFNIAYKGSKIRLTVNKDGSTIKRISGDEVNVVLNGKEITV